MRPNVPKNTKTCKVATKPLEFTTLQAPQDPAQQSSDQISATRSRTTHVSRKHPEDRTPGVAKRLNRHRAVLVLAKIDEILAWELRLEREREARFVELGRYLCEVRDRQYWRVDNLKSFNEFLEKKFPGSRRKAYYLMAIAEELPQHTRGDLRQVGWAKAVELARLAKQEGERFSCATWLHKAKKMPKAEFKYEVMNKLTGKDIEPPETICFTLHKNQLAVIEQALEAASPMIGGRKSRGYCLEFICADFIAGRNSVTLNPGAVSNLVQRFFRLLPAGEKRDLLEHLRKCA